MNDYIELFTFYINRYEISAENFMGLTENEIKNMEMEFGLIFPTTLKEILSYFGKDLYFSLSTNNLRSNNGLLNFFKTINWNFTKYIENEGLSGLDKDDASHILKLIKQGKLFIINQTFEGDNFFYIDISKSNPAVFLTIHHYKHPKPYYISLIDYVIKGLHNRVLRNHYLLVNKIKVAESSKGENQFINSELEKLKAKKIRLDEIIEIDQIKGT